MKKNINVLFQPFTLGSCEIKNRYCMVAMGTGGMVTHDGLFNERGVEYYVERAKGGVGLIITGTMYVENEIEKVYPGIMPYPRQNTNKFIMTSAEMIERIHAYDCKVFAQLTAGFGRVIKPSLLIEQPISVSGISHFWDKNLMCRSLTINEIETIIKNTAKSALICKNAGYDGIEIHAVHEGYLLDQFAISLFNNRTDQYGGNLKGRLKFACDIVKAIKEKCGSDFPVLLRYSLKSFIKDTLYGGLPNEIFKENGRDIDEGIEAARILVDSGYDALDIDSGAYESWYWAHPPLYFDDGLNISYGKIIKEHINAPVIIAGKMEDPDIAISAIETGAADIIGLGRSLLADPQIVNKIRKSKHDEIRPCIGCHNGCMHRLLSSKLMSCAVNPCSGREFDYALMPLYRKKNILIVGAGVAGMEAARVLALRGHNVTIHEKSEIVGGILNEYDCIHFKRSHRKLKEWYIKNLHNLKVNIMFNSAITINNIHNYSHDIIIIATGARAKEVNFEYDKAPILALQAFKNVSAVAHNIAIIGGGYVGSESALYLAQKGHKVTLFEKKDSILQEVNFPEMNRNMLMDLLAYHSVEIITQASIQQYINDIITYQKDNNIYNIQADDVILAIGYKSENDLYRSLMTINKEIYIIGDAKNVGNIKNAIWDAYEIARSI